MIHFFVEFCATKYLFCPRRCKLRRLVYRQCVHQFGEIRENNEGYNVWRKCSTHQSAVRSASAQLSAAGGVLNCVAISCQRKNESELMQPRLVSRKQVIFRRRHDYFHRNASNITSCA